MAITIGNNIIGNVLQRHLDDAHSAAGKATERLSSGLRVQGAMDDAAAFQVASSLSTTARLSRQSVRNITDGLSVIGVAEAALQELSSITQRQKEILEQAANGVYSIGQRRGMHQELSSLVDEYNRIIQSTTFNEIQLLQSGGSALCLQVGIDSQSALSLSMTDELERAAGNATFAAGASLTTTANNLGGMIGGDFNGDGKADLISAEFGAADINFFAGNGDGTFKAAISYSTGSGPRSLVAGDFNNDGKLDVAVTDYNANTVSILLGNGNGTFLARTALSTGSGPGAIEFADFNNDGNLDLVVGEGMTTNVNVFLGNGDGTFKPRLQTQMGGNCVAIGVGDFNGDGKADVAFGSNSTNRVFMALGTGDGSFFVTATYAAGTGVLVATTGDLNGDGYTDVVTGNYNAGTASVFLSNGNGSFKPVQNYTVPDRPNSDSISLADINGDGKLDLISASGGATSSDVYLYTNRGDGTFSLAGSFVNGTFGGATVAADFDGDGVNDLAITNAWSLKVNIYHGNTRQLTSMPYISGYTRADALASMQVVDEAFVRVTGQLGALGAHESRLEMAARVSSLAADDFEAAASRIRDADVAQEAAELVRNQILIQVTAALLAQANQEPGVMLQLLR